MSGCPFTLSRRSLLAGAATLAAAAPGLARAEARTPPQAHAGAQNVATAPVAGAASDADTVSPFGAHQAGIVTPRPANGLVAAFYVLAAGPDELEDLLRRLSERITFLTRGGPVPVLDPRLRDRTATRPAAQREAVRT